MAMDNFDISAKSLLSFNFLCLITAKCCLFASAHLVHWYYSHHKLLKSTFLYMRCVYIYIYIETRFIVHILIFISFYSKTKRNTARKFSCLQAKRPAETQIIIDSLKNYFHEFEICFHARLLGDLIYGCKLRKGYASVFLDFSVLPTLIFPSTAAA